jgi:hypothetical protein
MIRALYDKLEIPPELLIREPAAEYKVRPLRKTSKSTDASGTSRKAKQRARIKK